MTIECIDLDEFIACIAGLVKKGLTFEANAYKLVIKLTGGY